MWPLRPHPPGQVTSAPPQPTQPATPHPPLRQRPVDLVSRRARPRLPVDHRDCDSRIGDVVRDLLADTCLPQPSGYRFTEHHITIAHRASESVLSSLALAFYYPRTTPDSCAADPREACYVADPNVVVHRLRTGRR